MSNKLITAFTLVELLVVIAIVGILSGLIIVGMSSSVTSANIAKSQIFASSLRDSLLANLVSEWKFDEGSGTSLGDSWSNGNAGTLTCVANCWKSSSDCINGSCLYFPGNDLSYIQVADSNSLHFGDVTVSFWVYNGNGSSSYPTMYNKNTQNGSSGFWWVYTDSAGRNINWQYANGSTAVDRAWVNVFPVNSWSYLTFVYDNVNKTIELFINGVSKGKQNTPNAVPITSSNLFFGSYQGMTAGTYAFAGKFDEIRIFNSVMPASLLRDYYFVGLNKLLSKGDISKYDYKLKIIK